ncbi:LysR family transcriptional regulator [Alcanivorax sp. JB21]|uniref:LysR family transcriptional regulator n=1 Tax=Alcanivorax limicola TaxID=2874102 RepID=UPI001CBEAC88|nr:LysR family transcriptional regulator [Alcanivorax limicola]MBZ2188262.1 LysR family transcriptional regulator [Alcanivorax limicola]
MQDLNDLYYYVQVVDHGGFAPASRAICVPKSKLSRRIAALEERLGVRLIRRSTRHFSMTDVGQTYYAHCKAMLVEAEAAQESIEAVRAEPRGVIRVTCPTSLLHVHISDLLAAFMQQYPQVTVHLEATNRRVDVLGEGVDVALRARPELEDSELVTRVLSDRGRCLVASPALVSQYGPLVSPDELDRWPTLGWGVPQQEHVWVLHGPGGARVEVPLRPRLVTTDMMALCRAAEAGLGLIHLPILIVQEQLQRGSLLRVMPDWMPQRDIIHAVYPSRRGLLPSVRAFLDQLVTFYASFDED